MELTISGTVNKIEKAGSKNSPVGLWVAFCLERLVSDSRKNERVDLVKIILKGDLAEEYCAKVSVGTYIVASGSVLKFKEGALKLFAESCMIVS